MTSAAATADVTLMILVVLAAGYDLRSRRIPNWLSLSGALAGLALGALAGGWRGLSIAALGLALAFFVNLGLYALRAMGAGDVKLMAAVGALVGPGGWVRVFVLTALAGGMLALVVIAWRRRIRHTLWNVAYILSEFGRFRAPYLTREDLDVRSEKGMRLPRAVSIAVGALAYLAWRSL